MNENQLIEAIRARATRHELRNDLADRFGPEVSMPAMTTGLPGGTMGVDGHSLVELSRHLLDELGPSPFLPVVVLCDWGGGAWGCLDL